MLVVSMLPMSHASKPNIDVSTGGKPIEVGKLCFVTK